MGLSLQLACRLGCGLLSGCMHLNCRLERRDPLADVTGNFL